MPARTNDFQRLVLAIERAFADPEVSVQESAALLDRDAGKNREVDILITLDLGIRRILTAVECNAKARPATIEWIEQLARKHASLPTNKLVLVSKAGFTASAARKAGQLGIETLTLSEALSTDWNQKLPTFNLDFFTLPDVKSVHVDVCGAPLSGDSDVHFGQARILNPDGTDQGSLAEFVTAWVKRDETSELLRPQIPSGHTGTIAVDIPFIAGATLRFPNGITHVIGRIHVSAVCHRHVSRVSLSPMAYGGAAVAHGTASALGHTARVIAVERAPGDRRLGISLEKNQRRKQPRKK